MGHGARYTLGHSRRASGVIAIVIPEDIYSQNPCQMMAFCLEVKLR